MCPVRVTPFKLSGTPAHLKQAARRPNALRRDRGCDTKPPISKATRRTADKGTAMRVHIHANCQAIPAAGLIREVLPNWDVTFFEVHGPDIVDHIDDYHTAIRTADLVLSQPIHARYRGRDDMSIDWVRDNMRHDATLLVVPSVHFTGHHPGLDALPLPGMPELSNLLVAHLVAHGCDPEDVAEQMLSEHLLRACDIENEIRISIEETKRREIDDHIDVGISDFLEQTSRSRMLFHIYNHPYREIMAVILNGVFERLGLSARVPLDGHDYQPWPHVPVLPTIARFMRNHGGDATPPVNDERVAMHRLKPIAPARYYRYLSGTLSGVPSDELFAAIAKRWPTVQVLRRLARAGSPIPGIGRWLDEKA
jgi:Polysaccharide biosynthesis enzyme WcbI